MKTRFFAFAALALTLAACNNEILNNDGPVAAKFIADITPATRVNSEGTDWTDGDRIGVTGAGFTNVPYVRESGQFVPEDKTIYFNDTETKTFNAYYPYQSDGGTVTVNTAAAESPITMQLGGATTSQVIILPQEVNSSLELKVSFNGLDYTTTLPNPSKPEANQFSAGYAYTYNITLSNKGITVEEPEITPWEPGNSNDVSITL